MATKTSAQKVDLSSLSTTKIPVIIGSILVLEGEGGAD